MLGPLQKKKKKNEEVKQEVAYEIKIEFWSPSKSRIKSWMRCIYQTINIF